jgi:hypothetical protein
VTCGVGMALTTQLAFTEAHSRLRLVLGGKPIPVTVIFAPTMAAVGDTVIVGDEVAAFAGPAKTTTHSRAAVAARRMFRRFGLVKGHVEDCIARFAQSGVYKEVIRFSEMGTTR